MGNCVCQNRWEAARSQRRLSIWLLRVSCAVCRLAAAGAAPARNTSSIFPEPVTPIARETLHIHNEFMLVITILFVVVFAIMIYSMVKHRKSVGHQPAKFTGPTGTVQWFWALVPFAILLFIDFILMGIPAVQAIIEMEDTKTRADMVLKVTGMQWKWQYEYPGTDVKFISTMLTPREQISQRRGQGRKLPARGRQPGGAAGRQESAHPADLDRRHPYLVGAAVRCQARRHPRLPARNLGQRSRSRAPTAASAPNCAARTTASCRWSSMPCRSPSISPGWSRRRRKPRRPPAGPTAPGAATS